VTAPVALVALGWALAIEVGATGPGQAAVASAHPAATDAGLAALADGGNAFDAAVAVSAALAVAEPYGSGLGGGGFFLLQRGGGGDPVMLDARERAPLAATRDMYLNEQGEPHPKASIDGALAAGIPGLPAALVHLSEHYGERSLGDNLAPAIELARDGVTVDTPYTRRAAFRQPVLMQSFDAAAIFLDEGSVPEPGWRLVQPDLAATLERLAESGRAGFYDGPVAEALVAGVREAGGIWTREDLRDYTLVERAPVTVEYHGHRIVSASPPSSGGVVLGQILRLIEPWDLATLEAPQRIHYLVEAMRRAYHDRAIYLGDPDQVDMPLERLLSPDYAAGWRASIHPERATESASLPGVQSGRRSGRDTTHFSVLDEAGNRVAATLSINYPFGSGVVPAGTGVVLNDEMDDFSIKPGVPNAYGLVGSEANSIAPGKRMLSSMSPTFVESDDGVAILGTPGGSRIITMVLLGVLTYIEGGDAEALVSEPRFHHQYRPDHITAEPDALSVETQKALQAKGHRIEVRSRDYGNMQAITWDRTTGTVQAASDPRGIGAARVRDPSAAPP
jgi:gamma-glutamyltranspeptidase/glutathione hydrolase